LLLIEKNKDIIDVAYEKSKSNSNILNLFRLMIN